MNNSNSFNKGNAPPNRQAPIARNNVPDQLYAEQHDHSRGRQDYYRRVDHQQSYAPRRAQDNLNTDRHRGEHGQPNRVASMNRCATDSDAPGSHGGDPMRQRTVNFDFRAHVNAGHYQPSHRDSRTHSQPAPSTHRNQGAQQHGMQTVMGLPRERYNNGSRSSEATLPPRNTHQPQNLSDVAPLASSQSGPSSSGSSGISNQPLPTPAPVRLGAAPEIVAILQRFLTSDPEQYLFGLGSEIHRLEQERQTAIAAQQVAENRLATANEQHQHDVQTLKEEHKRDSQVMLDGYKQQFCNDWDNARTRVSESANAAKKAREQALTSKNQHENATLQHQAEIQRLKNAMAENQKNAKAAKKSAQQAFQENLQRANNETRTARERAANRQTQLQVVQAKLETATNERTLAQERAERLQEQLQTDTNRFENELLVARNRVDAAEERLRQQIANNEQTSATTNAELTTARNQLKTARNAANQAQTQADDLAAQIATLQAQFEMIQRDFEARNRVLTETIDALKSSEEELQRMLEAEQSETARLNGLLNSESERASQTREELTGSRRQAEELTEQNATMNDALNVERADVVRRLMNNMLDESALTNNVPEPHDYQEDYADFGQGSLDIETQYEVDRINAVHDSIEDQPGPSERPAWSGSSFNPRPSGQQDWKEPAETYEDQHFMDDHHEEYFEEDLQDRGQEPTDQQGPGNDQEEDQRDDPNLEDPQLEGPADVLPEDEAYIDYEEEEEDDRVDGEDEVSGDEEEDEPNTEDIRIRMQHPKMRKLVWMTKGKKTVEREKKAQKPKFKKDGTAAKKGGLPAKTPKSCLWDPFVGRTGDDGRPLQQTVGHVPKPHKLREIADGKSKSGRKMSNAASVKLYAELCAEQKFEEEVMKVIKVSSRNQQKRKKREDQQKEETGEERPPKRKASEEKHEDLDAPSTYDSSSLLKRPRKDDDDDGAGSSAVSTSFYASAAAF